MAAFRAYIAILRVLQIHSSKRSQISFVSTPRNIDRFPKIPLLVVSSITVVKILLPKVEQLPEAAEATMDIRNEDMAYLSPEESI